MRAALLVALVAAAVSPAVGVIRFFHHVPDDKWWVAKCDDECPQRCDVTADSGDTVLGYFECECPEPCPHPLEGGGLATKCDTTNLHGTPFPEKLHFLVGRKGCTVDDEEDHIACEDDCSAVDE